MSGLFNNLKMSKPTRKVLTVEQRVKVLELAGSGKSCRSIAEDFGVGKTQIQTIVKRKAEVLEEFEGNCSLDREKKSEKLAMKKLMNSVKTGLRKPLAVWLQ